MMVHTKGPWRAERQKSFSYSINTDYAHDRGHDCNVVREVHCEANAFLIAAAPELFEASRNYLKAVEERLNAQFAFRSEDSDENARLYQIAMDGMKYAERDLRAAIAKAEGR